MLKANVGLSRKLSEDDLSAGFSVNLEGEIQAGLDDPEAVIERVRELYDLADEALRRQIEAHRSDSAFASRDAAPGEVEEGRADPRPARGLDGLPSRNGRSDGKPAAAEAASARQLQFLRSLASRRKLSAEALEEFIEGVLGRRRSPDDLTRKEAGAVIDALNPE